MHELRVVIIDDEAWTRDTIKRIGKWRSCGFRIVGEASDGSAGLTCIKETEPHLIITDMNMPGLDGAQMLRELGRLKEISGYTPQIIIVSGYTDYAYTRQALSSKAIDYLLKPIDETEFNNLLIKSASLIRNTAPANSSPSQIMNEVDSTWLQKYQETRDVFRRSIHGFSEHGTDQAFSALNTLFFSCETFNRLKLLIRINQDLYSIIEEAAIAWMGPDQTQFHPHHLSFAIGAETSFNDVIEHYRSIVRKFISACITENQRKHRVDIRPICSYIHEHYQENISLEEIARDFAVSREYLSSLFRKENGCTFTQYILRLRMEKAKELITEYKIPIQKVPEMVGYIDIPHFYKKFKQYFAKTPGEIQKTSSE